MMLSQDCNFLRNVWSELVTELISSFGIKYLPIWSTRTHHAFTSSTWYAKLCPFGGCLLTLDRFVDVDLRPALVVVTGKE